MITLLCRSRCPLCGCGLESASFPEVTVNKRSVRAKRGGALTVGEGYRKNIRDKASGSGCPECGWSPVSHRASGLSDTHLATPWQPDAGSLAEIAAYRARRWPELTDEGATA